jgi:hypothetical protein
MKRTNVGPPRGASTVAPPGDMESSASEASMSPRGRGHRRRWKPGNKEWCIVSFAFGAAMVLIAKSLQSEQASMILLMLVMAYLISAYLYSFWKFMQYNEVQARNRKMELQMQMPGWMPYHTVGQWPGYIRRRDNSENGTGERQFKMTVLRGNSDGNDQSDQRNDQRNDQNYE